MQDGTTATEPDEQIVVTDVEGPAVDDAAPPDTLDRLETWVRGWRPAWRAFGAFLLYQAFAFVIWVVPVLPHFTTESLGAGLQDSRYYQWALTWTPWAIVHHLSPLHDPYIFLPSGVELTWSAFIPGPALFAWPITALIGPLGSLNVIFATAPAMAAWAAYLLCNRLTHRFWPSFVGGFIFGFSAYMAGNLVGFANLIGDLPDPAARVPGRPPGRGIARPRDLRRGVRGAAGGPVLGLHRAVRDDRVLLRARVRRCVAVRGRHPAPTPADRALVLLAGVVAAVVLSPYLHGALVNAPDRPLYPSETVSSADLSSFVVPPPQMLVGGTTFRAELANLTAFPMGNGLGYIGIGMVVLLIGFAITERRRRSTWLLLAFVVAAAVFAMGPLLRIGGTSHGWMPGAILADTPLIQSAIPSRLALFLSLGVAVIAALWLAGASGRWGWVRWAIGLVAVLSLIPVAPHHFAPQEIPAFVSSDQVHSVLREGEIVYAIPYMRGDEMLWQATAHYWFNMAQGYIGPLPPNLRTGAMARGLDVRKALFVPEPKQFGEWLQQHGVTAVVMDDRAAQRYEALLRGTGLEKVYSGEGVSVWRQPGASP